MMRRQNIRDFLRCFEKVLCFFLSSHWRYFMRLKADAAVAVLPLPILRMSGHAKTYAVPTFCAESNLKTNDARANSS
jgi:hypothetical protein